MYLIQGKTSATLTIEQAIAQLTAPLDQILLSPLNNDTLFTAIARFSAKLATGELLPTLDGQRREEICQFCCPEDLRYKVVHELGELPFSLRRIDFHRAHFEHWRPLGVVVHITPANAPCLAFFAIIESLLVGNINWLRPSSSDQGLTLSLLNALIDCDESGSLADYVALVPVTTEQLPLLLAHADGVAVWGSDNALNAIRQHVPPGCRWITWGHKISFAWLVPAALTADDYDALADEVFRFSQQACSSPQSIFVDSVCAKTLRAVGEQLAQAMERRQTQWQPLLPDQQQAADITATVAFSHMDQIFAKVEGHVWSGEHWRIIWRHTTTLEPSPLFCTVLLRPLPRHQLVATLRPWRRYLQTCALVAPADELITLSQTLLAAGVNRITPITEMHASYAGEPHDATYALMQLARRVSVTLQAQQLPRQATLNFNPPPPPHLDAQPIMQKSDFLQGSMQPGAQLFFRSGGSSGVPKLAGYTYRDYHRQMQAAAEGLFAAGLDPARDRTLNLMYAGHLYGGLLSFFTVLDKLGATHYPMGGPHDGDYSDIAALIVDARIDTLIGMPGTLYQLFVRHEEPLRAYGGVRKLLLGGEHIMPAQRAFLSSFGIQTIRSALYGSVDAGPLGYACAASPEGSFHLMADVQWLEIVHSERDTPVAAGETGRLLFTSRARDGQRVVRYDIGDLGRWIASPCDCGAPTPRFELLGRSGNLVRIGTCFLPLQEIATRAGVAVQFILQYDDENKTELLQLLCDGDVDEVTQKVREDPSLNEALAGNFLQLKVIRRALTQFELHPQSGKTALVIDRRLSRR